MTDKSRTSRLKSQDRQDRLKAALKANMGRRKAQARARQAADATGEEKRTEQAGDTGTREED
ncbi:hypothetical protein [Pseudooceanicola nanhaiensis]|uniref:hypothetical protein n=1 Tax=Pseudooceanicola nanhaiensis TaxID=375761 RepID=UPI001CD4E2EB|nr:hypothetical protein [Pseudooceanicola nanhaiensis]MCA0919224.1 hypothetical protein [Pseudooceanicola nanhaiensis]